MKQFTKIVLMLSLFVVTGLSFAKGISVDDPYVREVPPGQMTSASFLILKNTNDKETALIKATSDVAKNVELHEHVHDNGMMKMRQVAKIVIPANGETILKPGGYHIMLIGLTRKIKAGDIIDINLEFDNGDKQSIKAEVKKIMQGMMKDMKHGVMDKMKIKKHVNPMPNLMLVYKKMGDKLNLSDDQKAKLDAGIKERGPKIAELTKLVMKI
ncbi:MAG: copper chaperone PCu(A)C, partial [Gammaproteobacteria bacterium]|nr:copper chaperone PCu(A)C [Gammaproteobacteria bacterium]